jgi:hypothetical protein
MDTVEEIPSKQERLGQVDRILRSPGFHNSEILRDLLAHLAQRSMEEPARSVKEYEIAVDALRRGPDFDPRVDSSVRVHSARLRTKLAEYYQGDGATEPVEVFLPKGTYLLSYRYRSLPRATAPVPQAAAASAVEAALLSRRPWLAWALAAFGLAATLSGLWKWYDRPASPPSTVRKFWAAFDSRPLETMVVFSNPRFVGSASGGLRYATPGSAPSPEEVNDRYTGIGEAMALHELTRLFDQLRITFRAKRSSLIAWDEARSRNLIFVGGPEVNDSQMQLPSLEQFGFKSIEEQPSAGFGGVVNLHPESGEEHYYFNSGPPYTMDYAVIGVVPALTPGRRALILAGRTTFGSQGATEFLLDENSVSALLHRLGAGDNEKLPFFEALLRVKISGGVPVRPELVLLKQRK